MTPARETVVAGAIIGAVHATFPALVLLGAVHVSGDAQAAIEAAITSYVTLGGLVFALFRHQAKQPAAPAVPTAEQSPVAARALGLSPETVSRLPGVPSTFPPRGT